MCLVDRFDGEGAFLSNFASAEIEYEGVRYPSVHHAFEATRLADPQHRELLAMVRDPQNVQMVAARFPARHRWSGTEQLIVMEELLRLKFAQEPLSWLLQDTGNSPLVNNNDDENTFWGVCRGVGQNHLGRLLMKLRAEMQAPVLV